MTTTSEDAFEMRLVSVDVLHDSLQHWSSSSGSVVLNPVTIMSSATETTHVFAAVSYRWIPEDQACSFTVTDSGRNWTSKSGSHTMIEAVLTLASREGIRWIWMDSLCIDQSDAQDKAHAIRHMGSIYGRCAFVAAFVTADATNVEDVGYYSRVWTLQEQVLAPKLFLFRGQWMTLDQERQFWVKTYREIPANPPVNSLREQCYRVLAILGAATRGPSLSLAQVQQICHHRQCFVDQDRVYGILGCLKFRAELPVDYSKSTDNLWDLLCCQAIANGDYTILFTRLGTSQQTKRFVDIRQRPDSALGFDLDWNSGVLQFDVACNNIFVSKLMHCKVETKFNRIPKLRVSKQPEPPTKFKIMSQYGVFDPFKKAYVAPPALPASLTVELVRKNSNTSATFKVSFQSLESRKLCQFEFLYNSSVDSVERITATMVDQNLIDAKDQDTLQQNLRNIVRKFGYDYLPSQTFAFQDVRRPLPGVTLPSLYNPLPGTTLHHQNHPPGSGIPQPPHYSSHLNHEPEVATFHQPTQAAMFELAQQTYMTVPQSNIFHSVQQNYLSRAQPLSEMSSTIPLNVAIFENVEQEYLQPSESLVPHQQSVFQTVMHEYMVSHTSQDALNFNRFLLGRSTIGGFPSTKADEGTDAQHSTAINTAFGDVVLSSAPDSQHPVLTSAQLELICDAIFRFHSDPTESERKQVQNTLAPLVLTFKKHSPEIGGAFNNMQSLFDKKQTLEVRVPNEVLEPLYQVSRQDVFLVWAAKWDAGKHGSFQRGLLCIKAGQESGKGGTLKPVCQFFAPMKHAALLIDGKWTLS